MGPNGIHPQTGMSLAGRLIETQRIKEYLTRTDIIVSKGPGVLLIDEKTGKSKDRRIGRPDVLLELKSKISTFPRSLTRLFIMFETWTVDVIQHTLSSIIRADRIMRKPYYRGWMGKANFYLQLGLLKQWS